jgi:predicted nucleotidyltransferase
VTTLIEEKKDKIRLLCQHFHVKRLDLFGSAARGDFQVDSSDLDFVVSFAVQEPSEYRRCYFGLVRGLEALLQRPVDLVTETSIRNPYFRQSVDECRQLIYAN